MNITVSPSGFTLVWVKKKNPKIYFNYACQANKGFSHIQRYGYAVNIVFGGVFMVQVHWS